MVGHPVTGRRAIVEVLDRDGHARQVVPVAAWPVSVGRAVDCDVVLDDPHVASRHAMLDEVDGAMTVTSGDTVNGVRVGTRSLGAGETAPIGPAGVMLVGTTRLRIRRAVDPVPAEVPLHHERQAGWPLVGLLLAATLAWSAASQWLATDPGEPANSYLAMAVGVAALFAVWSGCWALGSKLFRHRFDFRPHLRIALAYSLASEVVGAALPLLAFALSLPLLSKTSGLVIGAIIAAMVVAHLGLVLPSHRRAAALVVAMLYLAGSGIFLTRTYQTSDRLFTELYVTWLAPPAFRVAGGITAERFLEEAAELKPALDEHAKDEDGEDPEVWEQ